MKTKQQEFQIVDIGRTIGGISNPSKIDCCILVMSIFYYYPLSRYILISG